MRISQRQFEEISSQVSDRSGFLEELRKSFTESYAYDHFEWISISPSSDVAFQTLRAASDRSLVKSEGPPSAPDGDALPLYTTTDSDIPLVLKGGQLRLDDQGGISTESNNSVYRIKLPQFRADARFDDIDGSGYTVAVLDGGIDLDDPFFGPDANGDGISDRIVYQYDFSDNDADASDVDGHGSNVASIIGSSDGTYTGVAPGVNIAALKVFPDANVPSDWGEVEDALQWVINNAAAYNIVSVNMSFSDGGNYSSPVQLYGLGDELATLAAMDIVVVSSSGNGFYELNSIQGVAYPSADPHSLSIGSVFVGPEGPVGFTDGSIAWYTDGDVITPYSQRDTEMTDVFAPGSPVTGAGAYSELVTYDGTSQAAPHVTGMVVLAQQIAEEHLGRRLTYDEFRDLLISTAPTIYDGNDEDDNVDNTNAFYHRANMYALAEAILAMPPDPDPRDPTYFEVAALDTALPEGDSGTTSFRFEVTRSGDLTEADVVFYDVAGSGTDPAQPSDFQGSNFPSGYVTFAAGETTKTVTVQVSGDTEFEPDENFELTIVDVPDNGQIVVPSDTATIVDDEPETFFAISGMDAVKSEGNVGPTAFTFTVTRSGDTSASGSVDYHVSGIIANSADFLLGGYPSGTLEFSAGEISKTITVNAIADTDFESNETFAVSLSNPSTGSHITAASAQGTIINDDPAPAATTIWIQATIDSSKPEGDSGTTVFTFPVERYGDTSVPYSVNYAVTGGTADATDFVGNQLPSGTITFGAGETLKTISVEVAGDTAREGSEFFYVTLSDPNGSSEVTVSTGSAQGSIQGDDADSTEPVFTIRADSTAQAEGDASSTEITFTVKRSGDPTVEVSVDYQGVSSDADGNDFANGLLPAGTLSFQPGEVSKTLTIEVAGDSEMETDESFTILLLNPSPGTGIATGTAEITIANDDAMSNLVLAASEAVKDEGDSGTTTFLFTVLRSGDTSFSGTVDYSVSGADIDRGDFPGGVLPSGTLRFEPSETSKTLSIEVAGNLTQEGDEAFTVELSNPSAGMGVSVAEAGGLIRDDDSLTPATFLAIAADADEQNEGDAGATAFTFTVTRSGDISAAGSVDYAVSGNDVDGQDFAGGTLPSGTVTFAAGEGSKTLTIDVAGDEFHESHEGFAVTLFNASDGSEIVGAQAETTILSDDVSSSPATYIAVSRPSQFLVEGNDGTTLYELALTRTGDTSAAEEVNYAVSSLDSDAGDFIGGALPNGIVQFAEGQTSATVTIEIAADPDFEADELFLVHFTSTSAHTQISSPVRAATIVNDDPTSATTGLILEQIGGAKLEDQAAPTAFNFKITRTGDLSDAGWADYAVSGFGDNPADAGDFIGSFLPKGRVEFAAGEASKTFTVYSADDEVDEPSEEFFVSIVGTSPNWVVLEGDVVGTIADNDFPVTEANSLSLAAVDAVKAEGNGGATTFTFAVTRGGEAAGLTTVDYQVVAGDIDIADFAGNIWPEGTLTFADGETEKLITIDVAGDTDFELFEEFTVGLLNASEDASLINSRAHGIIQNDDPAPGNTAFSISALDAVKAEGDLGSTPFTFTVTRSGDTSASGSV